ncbi:MAG: hypothetical protein R3190_16640 [Thermoanaerobaculia bacterium]|nr:hypothetical protein [Thermoanaerobaculia bacterium]
MSGRARRWALLAIHAAAAVAFLQLLLVGLDYYRTDLIARPRHELYWELKPGGPHGHTLGVAGSVMMVVMLVYSLRKRWRPLRQVGSLRGWLDFHIFLGVWGPALVVLHSTFKVQGLVAISFWSMVVVAASGVFGRFLYVQIPRARGGAELSLEEARGLARELGEQLRADHGLAATSLAEIEAAADPTGLESAGLLRVLAATALQPLTLRRRLRPILRALPRRDRGSLRDLRKLILRSAYLHRRIQLWSRLQSAFRYWHVLHKPFAVLMYLFMIVHVAVAWATGYAWRPGG